MIQLLYQLRLLVSIFAAVIILHLLNDFRRREKAICDVISSEKKIPKRIYLNNAQNPIIIDWNDVYPIQSGSLVECGKVRCVSHNTNGKKMLPHNSEGAYIFHGQAIDFENLPLPRNPQKVIWALCHDESPKVMYELHHEKALNLFNFSSTFSRHSDVPFPLQCMTSLEHITGKKYFIKTSEKNLLLQEISPILYLQSNCRTLTDRDSYVHELIKFQRIDSYGACLNNKYLPNYLQTEGRRT